MDMKAIGLVCIATMVGFFGCSTENDKPEVVSISLSNKSGEAITKIDVCIESTSNCQQIPELGIRDTVVRVFTLPPGDGGFVYSSSAGNEPFTRRFGYFSNGHAMTNEYFIQIHSGDSVSISN